MWLLKSRWSNPMKHLIPYLQDNQKAADYLRQLRWPDGIACPRCGSDAVEPRERCDNGLQRFNCVHCAARLGQQFAMFTDWTSAIFEESKLRPFEWLLVIGLWQLKLNAAEIAAAADIQERTAQRCINLLDGGIYETYHLDPTRQLEHQVEADECYQSAGSKGLTREVERHDRAPRQRGLQLRGRATAEMGRPPLLGLVQRRDKADQHSPAAQGYLEVLENVRTATIKPIIAAKVKAGRNSSPMNTPSTISPRPTMITVRSTMAQASMRGVIRMAHVRTATRWEVFGVPGASSGKCTVRE
jgi:hypothetical protein